MPLTKEILPRTQLYKEWKVVLHEFGKLLDQYNSGHEVAYWYGERALTGFLAAAGWRARSRDGWSLEEFSGLRRTGGRQSTGRGDLWIGIGSRTFTVEAKTLWPQGPVDTAISDARDELDDAGDQLDSLHPTYQIDVPTDVCYVVPELNINGRHATSEHIKQFFTELPRALSTPKRPVGSFWYKTDSPEHKGKLYPGIIVVAQFWSRWPKRASDA